MFLRGSIASTPDHLLGNLAPSRDMISFLPLQPGCLIQSLASMIPVR